METENAYHYSGTNVLMQSSTDENDEYGRNSFRLTYEENTGAYYIMSMSSFGGYVTSLSVADTITNNQNVSLFRLQEHRLSGTSDYNTIREQLFDIGFSQNGYMYFVVHSEQSTKLVLCANDSKVKVSSLGTTLAFSQLWDLTGYLYNGTLPYEQMEKYYHSLNFESPFDPDERTMYITSDYGIRYLSSSNPFDEHLGLDFRTKLENDSTDNKRYLYSPVDGEVIFVKNADSSNAGKYVVIRTNLKLYADSSKYLYIAYLHMDNVTVSVGDDVYSFSRARKLSEEQSVEMTTFSVGKSGSTGNVNPHLHYIVFWGPENVTSPSSIWGNNSIDPIMFYFPDEYDYVKS